MIDANAAVAARSAVVSEMSEPWGMIDDLVGGTGAMRKAGTRHLPRWPQESADAYKDRIGTAVLFPAFARTSEVLAAKPFARAVKVEGINGKVGDWLDDIDAVGTDFQPFLASLLLAAMRHGLVGVLVDYPPADGVVTVAQEKAQGLRPYCSIYPATSVLGWRTGKVGGKTGLTQLRLFETVTEEDGEFGEKVIDQVRVLSIGGWATYRKNEKAQWVEFERGSMSIRRIPFVFAYGLREGFGVGKSPLLDLAYMNIEHFQSASDQQTITHVARVPILFAKGFTSGDKIVIGSNQAAMSDNPDADLGYVEHSGKAIEAGRISLLDLEDRMRKTGAELLVQRPGSITATEVRTDSEGNRSVLQKICEDLEESAEDIIKLMAEWVGEKLDPEVTLYKDFGASSTAEVSGDLLLRSADAGVVSRETAFAELQRMDVVRPGVAWTDEQKRISAQAPIEQPPTAPAVKV